MSFIEFTIKTYPSHNGVTAQLLSLSKGDELFIDDVFGDITYKDEGILLREVPPFISILSNLKRKTALGITSSFYQQNQSRYYSRRQIQPTPGRRFH